jgi:acetyl-CoA carboxylase carboxyl transferase subunit beta
MTWFKRETQGIFTQTEEKKEVPEGLWFKCGSCKTTILTDDVHANSWVCPKCDYHLRIGSDEYFEILFDNKYTELDANLEAANPLEFVDSKPYSDRIKATQKSTGLKDSMRTATGKVDGVPMTVCCMDFNFIGGSMGAVVGEKIARAVDHCIANRQALMIISKSGGARMMEAAFSLMQMAKSSAKLAQLGREKLPYISLMTDPTTGGVTASYAMLGDLNISEPGAMIGFAGPRVIKETIKRDLPKGFQTAEMVQETGFLDFIVHRKELKTKIAHILRMLM